LGSEYPPLPAMQTFSPCIAKVFPLLDYS
jgi:hypothetical protein